MEVFFNFRFRIFSTPTEPPQPMTNKKYIRLSVIIPSINAEGVLDRRYEDRRDQNRSTLSLRLEENNPEDPWAGKPQYETEKFEWGGKLNSADRHPNQHSSHPEKSGSDLFTVLGKFVRDGQLRVHTRTLLVLKMVDPQGRIIWEDVFRAGVHVIHVKQLPTSKYVLVAADQMEQVVICND